MNEVVIKPSLREQFLQGWAQCRVIFFSAPCGFGKSTAATALLSNHKTCVFSAEDPEFLREPVPKNVDAIVIDSLPALKDPEDQQTLCAWIRENPELHFVILSRGVLPGWLMPFRFTGLLQLIEARDLLFDRDTVRVFLEKNGCTPTEAEINVIIRDSLGYPLALTALSRLMQNGQPYTPEIVGIVQQEIYHYFEDNIFNRFSMPLRRMLLNIAPFDTFDAELAQMISGDSHINELISIVRHDTTMLLNADAQKYRFWSFFQQFLMWELRQVYTPQEQAAVYSRAGLYYELHEDYEHALECYSRCKDHHRVSEMLIRNAEQHPGVGHYYEMEKYYYAIPKEEILRSPSLMCGMSMLTSLCMDYEASEMWYSALQEYAAPLKKTDTAYKEVRGKLAYLDISLPQRSSKGIAENIDNYFKILTDKSLQTPTFSVTSMLPSLMNGGKDFCSWSKHDELLYKTIRKPMEAILGKDGIGFADCALCESKFEKGEDNLPWLMTLVAQLPEIERHGTPDMTFAIIGLMARAQTKQGNAIMALSSLDSLRTEFEEDNKRFLPNIDAMRCRIWLRTGEMEKAEQWYRTSAPQITPRIRTMWRYQYITRAMVEIALGEENTALLTLASLIPFCERCGRVMDRIYIRILTAVCYQRQNNARWQEEWMQALDATHEYRFVMPIAQFGAAVMPMLTFTGYKKDEPFFSLLLQETRRQAVLYPNFLRPMPRLSEPLSPAETQVLRLLCGNRSNQEIADILGVKVATVKTHVIHILQKLGVKRRGEAKEVAQKLHIIEF